MLFPADEKTLVVQYVDVCVCVCVCVCVKIRSSGPPRAFCSWKYIYITCLYNTLNLLPFLGATYVLLMCFSCLVYDHL